MAETQFLNLDLDLESNDDLSSIIGEFGERVIVMNHESENGVSKASFEIAGLMSTADDLFAEYFSLIDGLSTDARSVWDSCYKRAFDLGFESGTSPHAIHEVLKTHTIQDLANIGGTLVVTVYAASVEDIAT